MELKVKIQGLDKVKSFLKYMPSKTTTEIGQAIEKSVITVENNAKKEAPTNKQSGGGNLKQSIKGRMTGALSGEVVVDAKYGLYVEEGTRPHVITVQKKRVLANRRTGQVFGKTVNHPGTRANPFLKRAVDNSTGKIQNFFNKAISAILKS